MKKFFRDNQIACIWFISYLVVLALPLLFNIYTYGKNDEIILGQVEKYNTEVMKNVQKGADSILEQMVMLAVDISYDNRIAEASSYKYPLNTEQRMNLYNLIERMESYSVAGIPDENIFVYMSGGGFVINSLGVSEPDRYFKQQETFSNVEYPAWYEYITDIRRSGFQAFNNSVVCYKLVVGGFGENPPAIVVFTDKDNLLPEKEYAGSEIFAVDNNNELVFSASGNINSENIKDENLRRFTSENRVKFNGGKYVAQWMKSSSASWQYVILTDENEYLSANRTARRNIVYSSVICFVLGICIIFYSVKMNKRPINQIMNKLNRYNKINREDMHEYKYIDATVTEILNQNREYRGMINLQKHTMIENMLTKLVKNNITAEDKGVIESLGIHFENDCFCVIIFYIEDLSEMYRETISDAEKKITEAKLIISNIFEELTGSKMKVFMFDCDYLQTCIVNMKSAEDKNYVVGALKRAGDIIAEEFNFTFACSISGVHDSIDGTEAAYRESMQALEQHFIDTQETVFDYDLISKKIEMHYYYPMEKEMLLVASLKRGNFDKCREIVESLFKMNFEGHYFSASVARLLMFDVVGTFIKVLGEVSADMDDEFIGSIRIYERIEKCKTAADMQSEMIKITKDFCEYFDKNVISKGVGLVDEIMEFVNEHYSDDNLNISTVAQAFGANADYISALFKKTANQSLLEYIAKTRVNKAMQLIVDTDYTIEKISRMAGFANYRTFSRVFLKYTGVSPGEYRIRNREQSV